MSYYQKHVFICVNQRDNEEKCCNQANAQHWFRYFKDKIKNLDLAGQGKIRVSHSGCLGRCAEGPVIVIYPEQVWYTYQSQADIDEIINEHFLQQRIVKRLLLSLP